MDTTTPAAFLAVDLPLVFTPGADWAHAITAGIRGRSVVPAVAGLIAGYAGYTLLAVAGLVVIVANSATLLTALTAAGAGQRGRRRTAIFSPRVVTTPPAAPTTSPCRRD